MTSVCGNCASNCAVWCGRRRRCPCRAEKTNNSGSGTEKPRRVRARWRLNNNGCARCPPRFDDDRPALEGTTGRACGTTAAAVPIPFGRDAGTGTPVGGTRLRSRPLRPTTRHGLILNQYYALVGGRAGRAFRCVGGGRDDTSRLPVPSAPA